MIRFELKKIFLKPANKIAVAMLIVVLGIVSYFAIRYVDFVDENGDTRIGITAARALRQEKCESITRILGALSPW